MRVKRTTVNKYMTEVVLDVVKHGRRVTITVPSIKRAMIENIRASARPTLSRGN
jgi:hypothetical protein